MKLNLRISLITALVFVLSSSFAQFTKKNSKTVGTKEKTELSSTRQKDLQQYVNQLFIIDNAINSYDKQKLIESAKLIKELSKREIARTENDLIDLYNIKPQTEEVALFTSKIKERLNKEKQKYNVIVSTDFNDSENVKQAMYAHSSMKHFKGYMQENYNEIDKPKEKKPMPPKDISGKNGKTSTKTEGGGMMSASGNQSKNKQSNNQQGQNPNNKINPALQNYYNTKNANNSSLRKISGDLSSALLKNDTERTEKLKKEAIRKMKQIIDDDKTLLRRINGGDPALNGTSSDNLNRIIVSENNILKDFKNINFEEGSNNASQLLSDFMRLPTIL